MKKAALLSMLFFLMCCNAVYAGDGRIYGATFSTTYLLYIMAPDLIAGWNGPLRDYEKKYIPERYHNLPVLGGWYGQGMTPNKETLLSSGIDKAFILEHERIATDKMKTALEGLNIKTYTLKASGISDYPELFLNLGRIIGRDGRGKELAGYSVSAMKRTEEAVSGIPAEKRKRVYLAIGNHGLISRCAGTGASEAIEIAGGVNVHDCGGRKRSSNEKVSLEQVLLYEPDVILVTDKSFYKNIFKDSGWKRIRAVREGQVVYIPGEPFSWLDKPAGFMPVMAAQYLSCRFYPDRCAIDIEEETKTFLSLFFGYKADGGTVREILDGK